jgi:hypothetical protein
MLKYPIEFSVLPIGYFMLQGNTPFELRHVCRKATGNLTLLSKVISKKNV